MVIYYTCLHRPDSLTTAGNICGGRRCICKVRLWHAWQCYYMKRNNRCIYPAVCPDDICNYALMFSTRANVIIMTCKMACPYRECQIGGAGWQTYPYGACGSHQRPCAIHQEITLRKVRPPSTKMCINNETRGTARIFPSDSTTMSVGWLYSHLLLHHI